MAITDLSLDDVMRLPLDPQKLAAIGLLTPPAQPAAPAVTVAPMTRPQVGPPTMGETEAGIRPKIPSWQPIATGAPPAMQPLEALPETAAASPGETLSGIRPMAPPRPTEKESVAAGVAEHGTTPGEKGKRQFGELRPTVTAPPGSAEFWRQTVAQQEFDRAHPWGADVSAHPGTLGKIGHVLGRIGNVAGNIVAPGTMALIPGTEMNKAERRATAEQELGKAETRESEGKLREAQTERERAQTEAIEHPEPKPKEEKWTVVKDFSGPNGEPLEVEENSGLMRVAGSDINAKKTEKGAEAPLANTKIAQLNAQMEELYKQVNPGKELPAAFKLPDGASQKDFDDADKNLKSLETMTTTQAQRDISNNVRQEMLGLAKEAAEERKQSADEKKEKSERAWVMGTDKTGKPVAMPLSEARKAGLENLADIGTKEVNDILSARHAVQLMKKQGDEKKPDTMGVLQLVDSLDRDDKLGVMASRWNNFMLRGVGKLPGDDPRIATLLDKGELAMTASMQAHFGATGGRSPQMLQHFLDMANAKKMDANALRAGFKAVLNYMEDRGMVPAEASGKTGTFKEF